MVAPVGSCIHHDYGSFVFLQKRIRGRCSPSGQTTAKPSMANDH
ncbi:hypothetical protein ARMA_2722 [Ardenticatena maritima]|uniref:Uncharacterized protein n=1 Tax=Ardenticatena maritima TaxID=872965 RepID=A0A0M8KBF7_9CHLR|nr:hypothetical protein ARMA_2722 [Ardenticatena maritima]